MLHRRTTTAGIRLRLEERTQPLERMLTITGVLDHFVPDHRTATDRQARSSRTAYSSTPDGEIPASGRADDAAGPDTGA